jgi:3-hydroxyacyl-[acyl-carrier-protein] dehydratase
VGEQPALIMRFHLIDRIDAWEAGTSVTARKLTSYGEEFWEPAGADLRMPPPFILEALCQAGTWLLIITTGMRKRAALLSINSVEWHGDVHPGDVLEMRCVLDAMGDESAVLSGQVTVDGRTVLTASEIMCALMDADRLADLDDTARLQAVLTRAEAA